MIAKLFSMKVKIENVITLHPYVYFRDNGRVVMHCSKVPDKCEGTTGAYLLVKKTNKLYRCVDGKRIPVKEFEEVIM